MIDYFLELLTDHDVLPEQLHCLNQSDYFDTFLLNFDSLVLAVR